MKTKLVEQLNSQRFTFWFAKDKVSAFTSKKGVDLLKVELNPNTTILVSAKANYGASKDGAFLIIGIDNNRKYSVVGRDTFLTGANIKDYLFEERQEANIARKEAETETKESEEAVVKSSKRKPKK